MASRTPQGGWGLFCLLNYTPLPRRVTADEEAAQEGETFVRKSSCYKCRHLPQLQCRRATLTTPVGVADAIPRNRVKSRDSHVGADKRTGHLSHAPVCQA